MMERSTFDVIVSFLQPILQSIRDQVVLGEGDETIWLVPDEGSRAVPLTLQIVHDSEVAISLDDVSFDVYDSEPSVLAKEVRMFVEAAVRGEVVMEVWRGDKGVTTRVILPHEDYRIMIGAFRAPRRPPDQVRQYAPYRA